MKERSDLQEWILKHPQMLGEPLLVITSEFDRFDRSNNRLDILALDKSGVLTIVELKLDASRTLADLQAIRYAAFCSTITMKDVVGELSRARSISNDAAAEVIQSFLEADSFPELTSQPRIILAAGSINDQELTSAVLWLRRFSIDISCVELTPYRLPADGQIILVPRILIPLPEAREYLVSVERADTVRIQTHKQDNRDKALLRAIAEAYNQLDRGHSAKPRAGYTVLYVGLPAEIHYEWYIDEHLNICLHAQYKERQANLAALKPVLDQWESLVGKFNLPNSAGPWRQYPNWVEAKLRLPYNPNDPISETAKNAAETMKRFVDLTYPLLMHEPDNASPNGHSEVALSTVE